MGKSRILHISFFDLNFQTDRENDEKVGGLDQFNSKQRKRKQKEAREWWTTHKRHNQNKNPQEFKYNELEEKCTGQKLTQRKWVHQCSSC